MSEIELHRKLLGDAVRNDALLEALKRILKPGMTVADIGAGTGFLSFLARRLGAAQCHLYEYSGTLELAQQLARENGIDGLTFVQAHSSTVKKPAKADIVISETLGNFALEEGLLETLIDARRFLKPGGTLMPQRLRQFVAPVIASRVQDEIDVWPRIGHDLDFSSARDVALNNMYVRTLRPDEIPGEGAARVWDDIDFTRVKASGRRSGNADWKDLGGKTVHGFALWWEAGLVEGVTLSTSPYAAPTHWEQVYLPLLEPAMPESGETLELELGSDTSRGVRLVWETRVRKAGGKPRQSQRQDLLRGRL